MSLGYLISPAFQYENESGKPLVGGTIRVCHHGTTNPYITYADFHGNRNPEYVPLDAKGMAILLADDGNVYDVYCYDRNGVEQWARLNVAVGGGGGGGGGEYYAGEGIVIDGSGVISVDVDEVQSDWNETDDSLPSFINNKPDLATVAITGSYNDLSNRPALSTVAYTGNYVDLVNRPDLSIYAESADLATVATTGDYGDLLNTPAIPAALTAGNGVDITNDVISAKVDGTTIGINSSGELAFQGNVSDIFIAIYGTTTLTDIYDASAAGKAVFLKNPNPSYRDGLIPMYELFWTETNKFARFVTPLRGSSTTGIPSDTKSYAFAYTVGAVTGWNSTPYWTLPETQQADNGKVLKAYNDGTNSSVGWASIPVSDVEVGGTSVVNAQGVAEVPAQVNSDWNSSSGVSEILNKPDLSVYVQTSSLATVATTGDYGDLSNTPAIPSGDQLVPPATAADEDKVLTVDSTGTPVWGPGGETLPSKTGHAGEALLVDSQETGLEWGTPTAELFEAVYGTTTYAQVSQAIAAKKIVYCRVPQSGTAVRMAFLAYVGSNNAEFQYYRSKSSRTYSSPTDEIYVYTVNASGWTTTVRNTDYQLVAGSGLSYTVTTGTTPKLTLSADPQQQADWAETDSTDPSYIQNKPTIPSMQLFHHYQQVSITAGQYVTPETYNLNAYVPANSKFYGSLTIERLSNIDNTSAYHFVLAVPGNEMTCNFGTYPAARQSGHNIGFSVDNSSSGSQYQLYFKLSGQFEAQNLTVHVDGIVFN